MDVAIVLEKPWAVKTISFKVLVCVDLGGERLMVKSGPLSSRIGGFARISSECGDAAGKMESTASGLHSRNSFQRLLAIDRQVNAGGNPLWLFVPIGLVVAYLVLPPLFFIVYASFIPPLEAPSQALTFSNYLDIFASLDEFKDLAWNSVVFSVGSSAWAICFGTALAWLAERSNARFRSVAYISAFVSFAIPGLIKVIGWILLLGPKAGLLNVAAASLTGIMPIFNIFSMSGMVLIEGFLWTPVVFLLMATPFRSMDPSLEEAAVVAGSSDWQVFRKVTLRMAMPSVLSVLLLTFIRSLEAFEIPALVGIPAGIQVFTTQIYLQLTEGYIPEYGFASAYSVLLIAAIALALIPYYRVTKHADRFTTVTGRGFNPRRKDLGKLRWLGGALLLILPALQLLPLLALVWSSLTPYLEAPSRAALGQLTFDHYVAAFSNDQLLSSIINSLIISLTSASGAVLIAFIAAWLVARTTLRSRWMLDRMIMLPLVFPGIVMAVAILKMYLTVPIPIYGTIWIMVVAFAARFIPYAMRFCHSGLLGIHKELEESATASGATWGQVARNIVVPLMMPALFAAWIYIFLITIREFAMALLLYSPGSEVISVIIWELWENGQVGTLSAYSLGITAATVLLASAFYKVSQHFSLHV